MLWNYENTFCAQRKFIYKKNYIQQFLLSCQNSMHVHDSTTTHTCAFLSLLTNRSASRFCVSSTTHLRYCTLVNAQWRMTQKRKMVEKIYYFCFLCTQKVAYSRSSITLRMNLWCYMDYFVLTAFLALECVSCVALYAGSESSWISSKIS